MIYKRFLLERLLLITSLWTQQSHPPHMSPGRSQSFVSSEMYAPLPISLLRSIHNSITSFIQSLWPSKAPVRNPQNSQSMGITIWARRKGGRRRCIRPRREDRKRKLFISTKAMFSYLHPGLRLRWNDLVPYEKEMVWPSKWRPWNFTILNLLLILP